MKAAFLETPGAPDVLRYGDLPTPASKAGEILIRVATAALNPIDTYIRAGVVKMQLPMPFVTGSDVAGTVEAVGANVKRFKAGDRVWGSNQGLLGRQGTCAEYVCASEDFFYPTPAGVSDDDAAAVALVGITAHLGLFQRANLKAGEIVFVNGGTGGVGSMVCQMAKAMGAKAIATVGSPEKAKLCQSWGVDCVLNYKTDDVPARIKEFTQGQGVNVWYETQREPDFVKMIDLMARRGRMIVMAGRQAQPTFPVGPFYVKDLALHGFAMFNATTDEQRTCADDINRWLAEKKLHIHIGKTFNLAEAAAAHHFLEENTLQKAGTLTGKVVLHPQAPAWRSDCRGSNRAPASLITSRKRRASPSRASAATGLPVETVNRLTMGNQVTLEQASKQTWTYQQAVKKGFTRYQYIDALGSPGNYTSVDVVFLPERKKR